MGANGDQLSGHSPSMALFTLSATSYLFHVGLKTERMLRTLAPAATDSEANRRGGARPTMILRLK
eukprot:6199626-Pleurochrysis_carterae.AAC.3